MEEKESKLEKVRDALEGEVDNVRDFPEETLCPSCGKFVGAYEKCPYCGAILKKRMAIAIFKKGCLVMSVVGLIALWYAAVKMNPKLITIGEISPTYNKGIFAVKGVVDKVKLDPDAFFKVQFWVDDGSGKLKVQSGDIDTLKRLGKLPNVGDEVEAMGEISLSAQFGTSMNLKAPDRMKLERAEIQTAKIGEMEAGKLYSTYGEVVRVRESKNRVTVVLGDETGIVEISLYSSALKELPDAEAVMKPGSELELAGTTSLFRGKLGIKPTSFAEVKVSEEDKIKTDTIATKRIGYAEEKIGSLKPSDKGKKVKVRGKISDNKQIPKGTKFNLSDTTGSVEVTLWDDDFADYPNKAAVIKDGSEIIMYGRVDEYKGNVQLSPQDHLDLQPVKKSAPPKKKEAPKPPPPAEKKPEAPKPAPPAEKKAEAPKPPPPPAEKKPEVAKPPPPAEKKAEALKPVETKPDSPPPPAEKKPEVTKPPPPAEKKAEALKPVETKPDSPPPPAEKKPEATKPVETKPETPAKKEEPKAEAPKKSSITFTPMKIGDITMEKDGSFAEIKGEVLSSYEFSKGLKLDVKDDSGTIEVVLWNSLLEKLTNKDELTKDGAKLSIKGKIGSYGDKMQLSPRYPNQIKAAE